MLSRVPSLAASSSSCRPMMACFRLAFSLAMRKSFCNQAAAVGDTMCAAGQQHEHVVKLYDSERKDYEIERKELMLALQAALSDAAGCFMLKLHKKTSCLCVTSHAT